MWTGRKTIDESSPAPKDTLPFLSTFGMLQFACLESQALSPALSILRVRVSGSKRRLVSIGFKVSRFARSNETRRSSVSSPGSSR